MGTGKIVYPFTAIVGQERMKQALILNVINPALGGVLIRGEKGTAKSTAVRALAELMPLRNQVTSCPYSCDPEDWDNMCRDCRAKSQQGKLFNVKPSPMRVVELPVSATEDRIVGTLDLPQAVTHGEKRFEPGLLAEANRNILYVDEVNLLEDHLVDVLLDAAAMGVNVVEREGVSHRHPSRLTLVGTMNPEEGDLRPQLLDRFGLTVDIVGEQDLTRRAEVIRRRLAYEKNPEEFRQAYEPAQQELAEKIVAAIRRLPEVIIADALYQRAAAIAIAFGVDGHRADIVMLKTAVAIAAFDGRRAVSEADLREAAILTLPHRMRRQPFEDQRMSLSDMVEKIDSIDK